MLRPLSSVIVFASLALSGCASAVYGDLNTNTGEPCLRGYVDEKKLARELSSARPCCSSLAELDFQQVKADGATPYGFGKSAPAFDFPSGRSRYLAFQLEPGRGQFLVVKPGVAGRTSTAETCKDFKSSVYVGQGSEWYRAAQPMVTYLGPTKQMIAAAVQPLDAQRGDFRFPIPADARFAVVHVDPSHLGSRLTLHENPATVATGGVTLTSAGVFPTVATGTGWFSINYVD